MTGDATPLLKKCIRRCRGEKEAKDIEGDLKQKGSEEPASPVNLDEKESPLD